MSASEADSPSLESFESEFAVAASEADVVKRFRALFDLVYRIKKAHSRIGKKLKEFEKSERYLEIEKRFLTKHETRLDALGQALFQTYSNPAKARETLDQLSGSYDPRYVMDVVKLGPWRLGRLLGVNLLGLKSESRRIAEAYYDKSILPALEIIVPDHGDYIKLKKLDVEARYDAVLADLEAARKTLATVEAAMKKYANELEIAAKSMLPDDIARLTDEEVAERLMLLPAKMREAELAEMKAKA